MIAFGLILIGWGYKKQNVRVNWIFKKRENSSFGNYWWEK
jgi:hypothetical protein